MTHRISIMRHGKTGDGSIYWGRSQVPLSPCGIKGVQKLSETLTNQGISAIFSSPQKRACQTANIISKTLCVPAMTDYLLSAKDYGELTGVAKADVHKCRENYRTENEIWGWTPSLGESYICVSIRLELFLKKILVTTPADHYLVVTHEGNQKVFAVILGGRLASIKASYDYGSILEFEIPSDLLENTRRHFEA